MAIPTLPGITARTITTPRLTTRVLFSGPDDGFPVLFLHGNTSSATWWEDLMVSLPAGFRGIAPDQRGFGDADPDQHIDATRGMLDLVDDATALLAELGLARAHAVGNSLGGLVVWQMMAYCPEKLRGVTLVDPGSPFGFGSTKDVHGTPCYDDFAGSGGGLTNPELLRRIKEGDRSTDSMFSPRAALRSLIVKPPLIHPREEELLSSMLAMHLGPQDQPGDAVPSPNWPFVGPGVWGAANGISPKYLNYLDKLYAARPKAKVLWIRGSHDLVVGDNAASDPGFLGQIGAIPGWPGADVFPPQPMVGQTRAVLEQYCEGDGKWWEVVVQDAGHAPYLDKLDEFNAAFHRHLALCHAE